MTTRNGENTQYRSDISTDVEAQLNAFREEMPHEFRETTTLDQPDSMPAAEAVVSSYRRMEEQGASEELLGAVIWEVTGITPDRNTDYARDAVGIITGQKVAANALARPPGERLHFTAMRASQYRQARDTLESGTGYQVHELNKLACQHNHVCHLIEGGLINDAGYYAMALAISTLAPLPNSLGYGVPRDGMTEEILAILAELHILGIIQSALTNDLAHYLTSTRDADQRTAALAELLLRNEGLGSKIRLNPPLPPPSDQNPVAAAAMLTMMSSAVNQREGNTSLRGTLIRRLNERAISTPETAPRQLAVASAIME